MSRIQPTYDPNLVEVKSKFECEFRRFCVDRNNCKTFDDFHSLVKESYHLPSDMPFTISYTDPRNGDLLPITNDDNLQRAFTTAMPLLRLFIYRKAESMLEEMNARAKKHRRTAPRPVSTTISAPQDFRRVCAIVDADHLPDTVRRVKLLKHSSDRPLGFYIRDGTSVRVTPYGLEKVPGIFISRLVPGGLAESTGLLAVNDEILEVNAIEVYGKTLDQVTDMMVANSQNLIITVKPVSQPPVTPRPPSMGNKRISTTIGPSGAKSYGDLPSMIGGDMTSSLPAKKSLQYDDKAYKRSVSDLKKPSDLPESGVTNGPVSINGRNGLPEKRHSMSSSLES